ncbi:DUF1206 domain-containing protein [Streptomyces sp. CB01635]|uniref:DUF1206 domain-containing protein n=1 Tax=unclassified Streptomyces TaxID=2593676 RepID=UPI001F47618E|nr:DUF1206 domain-containing protein [Streptomyces sp. CB01635]
MQIGFGRDRGKEADRSGAVGSLGEQPLGRVLLWALVTMALWRLSEAVFGQTVAGCGEADSPFGLFGMGGALHGDLYRCGADSAGRWFLRQSPRRRDVEGVHRESAGLAGRVLVGAFGGVLVIVGVVTLVRSLMRKFEKNLRAGEMSPAARRVVAAVTGLFVLLAAVRFDPSQAKGPDETLRSFATTPAGPVLLMAAAVGLVLFGLYSFCEAHWRRAAEHGTPAEQPTEAAGSGTRASAP